VSNKIGLFGQFVPRKHAQELPKQAKGTRIHVGTERADETAVAALSIPLLRASIYARNADGCATISSIGGRAVNRRVNQAVNWVIPSPKAPRLGCYLRHPWNA
jgi:hypothetical protein